MAGLDVQTLLATATAKADGKPAQGKAPAARLSHEQIERVASDFEAQFLSQMLAPMFEGLETDGYFGGGSGEKMYRSLLVDEYGKLLAGHGGIGIADSVAREMLKLQEVAQ